MSTLGSFRPVVNLRPDRSYRLAPVHYLDGIAGLPFLRSEYPAREAVGSDFYVDEFRHLVLRFRPNELHRVPIAIHYFRTGKNTEACGSRLPFPELFP